MGSPEQLTHQKWEVTNPPIQNASWEEVENALGQVEGIFTTEPLVFPGKLTYVQPGLSVIHTTIIHVSPRQAAN